MAQHRSRWSVLLAVSLVCLPLGACPEMPASPASWADEDTWVDPNDPDALDGSEYPDGVVPLTLERIFASTDDASGGARVTLTGTGFEQGMTVRFGEAEGSYILAIDDARLNVDVPPHEPGLVDVTVGRADGMSATLTQAFLYRSPIQLTDVTPTEGLITGGGMMTVTGEHFDDETRILIGGRQLIDAKRLDDQTIIGRIPARLKGWHGAVDVIASDGFEQRTLTRAFHYHDTLEISWISPNSGSVAGGTYVTLYGTGLTPSTVVRVNDVVAEALPAGAGDVLTIRVPPGHHGAVDIEARDPLQTLRIPKAFVYLGTDELETTAVVSAWPAIADSAGGTQVALTITGLPANATRDNVTVNINGTTATVLEVRPTQHLVVFSAPAGQTGPATIGVSTDDGSFTTEAVLTYGAGLHVDTFSPGSVPPETENSVTFEGRGFDAETQVWIDGVAGAPESVTDTSMSVTLPSCSAGRTDILITSGDRRHRIPAGLACKEPDAARALAVARADAAQAGGRLMRLHGEGFSTLSAPPTIMMEGEPAADVSIVDDAEIRFTAPAGNLGAVTVNAQDLGVLAMSFERFDPTVSYGGAWGGPMSEALNVTVLDMFTGAPIDGAFVTLWDDASTPYQGLTNTDGELTLSGPQMRAPQMVTASKALYTTASIVDFDARNATVLLIPLTSAPPAPPGPGGLGPQELPDGTLAGEVVTIDKFMLPPPGECDPKLANGSIDDQSDLCRACENDDDCTDDGARCVDLGEEGKRCTTACTTEDDCPEGFMCTGVGGGGIQCLPRPGDKGVWCGTTIEDVFSRDGTQYGGFSDDPTTYTFEASPGEHAVVCLGGFTNPDTGVFKPVLMGVRRHVFSMPGDFVGQQDLILDIPLNRSLKMRLDDPPTGPGEMNQHRIDIFLDLGPDGVFPMPQQVIGEDVVDVIELPGFPAAFEESLYDASYSIYASALMPETLSGVSGTGSYTLHTDITAVHDDAVFEVFETGARVTATGIHHDVRAMDGAGDTWAWAVGDGGKILAWDGTWWGLQQAPTKETLHDVYVRSTVDVWAAGERGTVVHWDGLIWRLVEVPEELATANWRAVKGHASGAVWFAGDKGVWTLADGLWSAVDLGEGSSPGAVHSIWVAGADEVWFVGAGGLIRQVVGGQPKTLDVPGADLHAVDGVDGEVWAVGARGRMLRYNGEVWFDYLPVTLRDLHAVHAPATEDAWVTGDAGTVLRWDGERWRIHAEVEHVDLRGAHVTAEGRVLIGGMHVLVIGPFLRAPVTDNPRRESTMNGNELAWSIESSHPASFTYLQMTESQGFPFWIHMVDGARTSIPLPDLFAMQGLMSIWPGPGFLRFVRVYAPDFDIDSHDNSMLSQFYWRSWITHDVPVVWGIPDAMDFPGVGQN
ncbi:MAG: IPT/TIG domain-containing protein [Myxococcota bacterium]